MGASGNDDSSILISIAEFHVLFVLSSRERKFLLLHFLCLPQFSMRRIRQCLAGMGLEVLIRFRELGHFG